MPVWQRIAFEAQQPRLMDFLPRHRTDLVRDHLVEFRHSEIRAELRHRILADQRKQLMTIEHHQATKRVLPDLLRIERRFGFLAVDHHVGRRAAIQAAPSHRIRQGVQHAQLGDVGLDFVRVLGGDALIEDEALARHILGHDVAGRAHKPRPPVGELELNTVSRDRIQRIGRTRHQIVGADPQTGLQVLKRVDRAG